MAVRDSRATNGSVCHPPGSYAGGQDLWRANGRQLRPFHFAALGTQCVIGHHTACAEIKGLRFSSLFAWLLWRTIYLEKPPGLDRKVRVMADWAIELFFPRDIVQTIDLGMNRHVGAGAQLPPSEAA